jgi:hypothetical protein
MRYGYSEHLRDDVISRVQAALLSAGIVNVAAVAEAVRVRNLAENVALEDIEHLVMQAAQFYGAAMEFDGLTTLATSGPLPGNSSINSIEDRTIPLGVRRADQIQ